MLIYIKQDKPIKVHFSPISFINYFETKDFIIHLQRHIQRVHTSIEHSKRMSLPGKCQRKTGKGHTHSVKSQTCLLVIVNAETVKVTTSCKGQN